MKNKKGIIEELPFSITALLFVAIVSLLSIILIQSINTNPNIIVQCTEFGSDSTVAVGDCAARTAINKTLQGQASLSNFWSLLVIGIVASIVVGIILGNIGSKVRR